MTKLLVQLLVGSLALAHLCQGAPKPEEAKAPVSSASSSSSSSLSSSSAVASDGVASPVVTTGVTGVVTTVQEKVDPQLLQSATSALSNLLETVPQTTGDVSNSVASVLNSLSSITPATSNVAQILQAITPLSSAIKATASKAVAVAVDGSTSQLFTFSNGRLYALVPAPAGLRISSIVQPTVLRTSSGQAVMADAKTTVIISQTGNIVGTLVRGDDHEGLAQITNGVTGLLENILDSTTGSLGGVNGRNSGVLAVASGLPILNLLSGGALGGILGGATKPVTKVVAVSK